MNSLKAYLFGGFFLVLVASIGINIFTFQSISKKNILIAEREAIIAGQNKTIERQKANTIASQQASDKINAQRQKNLDYMRGYNEAVSKIRSDVLEIDLSDDLIGLLP